MSCHIFLEVIVKAFYRKQESKKLGGRVNFGVHKNAKRSAGMLKALKNWKIR
jgi:hypothetical protein